MQENAQKITDFLLSPFSLPQQFSNRFFFCWKYWKFSLIIDDFFFEVQCKKYRFVFPEIVGMFSRWKIPTMCEIFAIVFQLGRKFFRMIPQRKLVINEIVKHALKNRLKIPRKKLTGKTRFLSRQKEQGNF
jgi:hypothetical protein